MVPVSARRIAWRARRRTWAAEGDAGHQTSARPFSQKKTPRRESCPASRRERGSELQFIAVAITVSGVVMCICPLKSKRFEGTVVLRGDARLTRAHSRRASDTYHHRHHGREQRGDTGARTIRARKEIRKDRRDWLKGALHA